jgi:hypothetical protein
LNLFFSAPKALSIVTLSEECLKLNNSLALVGMFFGPYSDKWYLTPCRRKETIAAPIPNIYKVEFIYRDIK